MSVNRAPGILASKYKCVTVTYVLNSTIDVVDALRNNTHLITIVISTHGIRLS